MRWRSAGFARKLIESADKALGFGVSIGVSILPSLGIFTKVGCSRFGLGWLELSMSATVTSDWMQ
jgi:hypothetical protein